MKILQLHTGFNLLGGVESMIIGLANEMAKTNDVTVCSVFEPNDNSVFYTRLSNDVKKIHLGVQKPGISIGNLLKVIKYLLNNTNYDIVHFHGLFYYFAIPIILTHNKTKYVYTFHSDAYKEQGIWDKRIFFLKKYCLKKKWMYPITISPQSRESFLNYYHLDSKLIQNGIPFPEISYSSSYLKNYHITPTTRVFVHPGRISLPKNQVVLCKVFERLIKDGEDVVLLIVGSKQDDKIFEELSCFFSERIVYLGEVDNVPQLLSEADGLCLPSIWEGLPITLLESIAVGCIPICSPVGGIVSVIEHGETGFLSKSSSEEDYYYTMKEFLRTPLSKLCSIKSNCKLRFELYDIKYTAREYISYYKEILK